MHVIASIAVMLAAALTQPQSTASTLTLQPCQLRDVSRAARCGTLTVPENRADPRARSIALNIAILEAPGPKLPDPVVFFAGGPGQGAVAVAGALANDLASVAPDRDIILIDQRGTGASHPLTCAGGFTILSPSRAEDLRRCRNALAERADLTQYGTDESVADVADVLRSLGHTRVNIVGASYGTRLALHFMQRHPSLVRTAVLRAIAPHDFNIVYDGGRQSGAALARLLTDCSVDKACAAAFPDLQRDLETIRTALREPVSVGGVLLTHDLFERTIYALLLSTQTRQMLPLLIHTAATKGVQILAGPAASVEAVYDTVAIGAYLSVVCREDVPRLSASQKLELREGLAAVTDAVINGCATWSPNATPIRQTITPSDVPTLIVSGELDPAMPPPVAARALTHLHRGTHLVVPATAHIPMLPGCANDLVRAFIASGGTTKADATCLASLTLSPFRTP